MQKKEVLTDQENKVPKLPRALIHVEALSEQIKGEIQALDEAKNTITLVNAKVVPAAYRAANRVAVFIDGEPARFGNLKPHMQVGLYLSAQRKDEVIRITAFGPKAEGVVKAVNMHSVSILTPHGWIDIPKSKEVRVVTSTASRHPLREPESRYAGQLGQKCQRTGTRALVIGITAETPQNRSQWDG